MIVYWCLRQGFLYLFALLYDLAEYMTKRGGSLVSHKP